jgi:hypothetical protein
MGETANEIPRLREARDHQVGRAVSSAGQAHTEKLGIARATFYHWYDLYRSGGPEALADHRSRPSRVWNRIPDAVREKIVRLALDEPTLSPRELSVRFTDSEKYFVSEASVYRLFKAHDLIASPAFIVIKAADEFKDKTTVPTSCGRPTSPT